ncbi:MAG TPA: isoprenylcysteine carboxylmethyltransferase family protein [Longimicrobiales bacterium]
MSLLRRVRLKAAWGLAPVFLLVAHPTPKLIGIGAALAIIGGLLRAWASGTIRKKQVLTTGGPYAYTRNPLYLGSFFVGLGLATAGGSILLVVLFLACFAVVYGPTMRAEERELERLFGDRFREYVAHVPIFFPQLRAYRPAEPHPTQFLLRRYFGHREYQLALGVLVGFLLLAVKLAWV